MNENLQLPLLDPAFVFHGSSEYFDVALPQRHKRVKKDAQGEPRIIFDQVSFHATPYRWVAIAYTYSPKRISKDKDAYFNMGVDLYKHTPQLDIYGIGSLEESLQVLYGKGGYVSKFKREDFLHTEGLGHLELITTTPLKPV